MLTLIFFAGRCYSLCINKSIKHSKEELYWIAAGLYLPPEFPSESFRETVVIQGSMSNKGFQDVCPQVRPFPCMHKLFQSAQKRQAWIILLKLGAFKRCNFSACIEQCFLNMYDIWHMHIYMQYDQFLDVIIGTPWLPVYSKISSLLWSHWLWH